MEYIKYEKEYNIELQKDVVFTGDFPLKWSGIIVEEQGTYVLKLNLVAADPGIDIRSVLTTVSLAIYGCKAGRFIEEYFKTNLVAKSAYSEQSFVLANTDDWTFYSSKVVFTQHVPKIRSTTFAGYNFSKYNTINDKVLVVGGKGFHVNKAVLSAYSPVFDNFFNNENLEDNKKHEIVLEEIDPNKFEVLLKVIFPTNVTVNEENVEFLWKLADRFDIACVAQMCENFVCNLSDSPTGKLSIANRKRMAELYISDNLKDVIQKMENLGR